MEMKKISINFEQILSIDVDEHVTQIKKNIKGLVLHFNFDFAKPIYIGIANQLHNNYLNEGDVSRFMLRIVKPGDVVADVGANIGFYTAVLALLVGEQGKVIAFEPSQENVDCIKDNLEINRLSNVSIRKVLIGNASGESAFFKYEAHDSGTSYAVKNIIEATPAWKQMPLHTLDEELAHLPNLKLVKIDIEGFEVAALKGAELTLKSGKVKYWIVEYVRQCLERNGESLQSLRDYMSQFDLQLFILDYEGGFPKLYPPNVIWHGDFLNNLLFAKLEDLGTDWVYDDTTFLSSPRKGFSDKK